MGKIQHEAQQRARPINEQCVRHERGRNIIYGTKQIESVSYNLTSIAWVNGRAEVAISMSRGVNTTRSSSESLFYSVTSIACVKVQAERVA